MIDPCFNAFRGEEFPFEDQTATILYPDGTPNGKIVLRTEYLGAFPNFEQAMLHRGYYVINLTHPNYWANHEHIHQMARFVRAMAEKLGADERCILSGVSAGGLQVLRAQLLGLLGGQLGFLFLELGAGLVFPRTLAFKHGREP